jgi:ribonuclease R
MEDLGPDHWKYNARAQCIDGQRSGRNIRLGQAIKVRIVSVNVPARQLNVAPVELLADSAKKIKKSKVGRKSKKGKRRT